MAATPRLLSLSRFLTTTTKTTVLRRTFSSSSIPRFSLLRTISAARFPTTSAMPLSSFRCFSTRNSMNENTNRPPNETILLDGCDFEHWLVVTDPPPADWTRDQVIDYFIKILAQVVGSEEEARMKIYSVSTRHYFAFGALVSEDLSHKLKELEKVRWVLPDSYLDVKNKDYGGEPFINGQAAPYDPKYHEEWVRNNQKAGERNHRSDRPRNADRSRNFDRRQSMPPRNQLSGNVGGPPPNQHSGTPNHAPHGQNMPHRNASYQQNMPPNNTGYQHNMPPNNAGHQQSIPPSNAYRQNMPPNNAGYGQNMSPDNQGFSQNMPPPNNVPNQAGGGMPFQNNAPVGNRGFQGQNVPGRDVP